jgi:hypothetical protein
VTKRLLHPAAIIAKPEVHQRVCHPASSVPPQHLPRKLCAAANCQGRPSPEVRPDRTGNVMAGRGCVRSRSSSGAELMKRQKAIGGTMGTSPSSVYLLSILLRCGECGGFATRTMLAFAKDTPRRPKPVGRTRMVAGEGFEPNPELMAQPAGSTARSAAKSR